MQEDKKGPRNIRPEHLPARFDPTLSTAQNISAAKRLLDLGVNPLLMPRLDGKRPLTGGICAKMSRPDKLVRELVISLKAGEGEEPIELLRILDYDNGQGYRHFGLNGHESLPPYKVYGLIEKLEATFSAAIRILSRSRDDRAQNAVDDFLSAPLRNPHPGSGGPRQETRNSADNPGPGGPMQIEDQRFRITDDRHNQIRFS